MLLSTEYGMREFRVKKTIEPVSGNIIQALVFRQASKAVCVNSPLVLYISGTGHFRKTLSLLPVHPRTRYILWLSLVLSAFTSNPWLSRQLKLFISISDSKCTCSKCLPDGKVKRYISNGSRTKYFSICLLLCT